MNTIELSAVLFYADFLSLKHKSVPITDNCKYFYIHGAPINSCFILGLEPVYDIQNEYFYQAYVEYSTIKNKYGESGLDSFIDDICCIKACGSVDAERMLKCIHQYSSRQQRKQAYTIYNTWKNNQKFNHIVTSEDGDKQQKECSKYIYHIEKMLGKPVVAEGV